MISCCRHNKKHKECKRDIDGKIFKLPRKFSKNKCISKNIKGFTMKSSCAPYKGCDKVFNVYIDKNPKNTISIKYKTVNDVKETIKKLKEYLKTKKYTKKRIWQVAMILMVRLRHLKDKKKTHYNLALKFFKSL